MKGSFVIVLMMSMLVLMPLIVTASTEDVRPITLDNGLEIYQIPDNTVPLVSFLIAFRTGAMVETEKFDGLSHLYEHMLFKSNEVYKSQEEFDTALKEMGCPSWNGGTSTEMVSYFATVPSDQVENVIKFWATTVRTNIINDAELQKEKDVVINELHMYEGDPNHVFQQAVQKATFPKHYSRKNIGGSPDVIRSATKEQLEWLKKTYYVPNNCAVFIAGNFSSEKALAAVKKYFGDWPRAEDPFKAYPIPKHPEIAADKLVVVPNLASNAFFLWGKRWRGPDVMDEIDDTYPADILGYLTERKSGRFLTALEPKLWRKDVLSFGYYTQRNGGGINLQAQLLVGADPDTTKATVSDLDTAITEEFTKIASDPAYFTPEEIAWAVKSIEADKIYQSENFLEKANGISFWWAVSSTEYYRTYLDNLKKVSGQDITDYVKRYLSGKPSVEYYWISKEVAEQLGLEVSE